MLISLISLDFLLCGMCDQPSIQVSDFLDTESESSEVSYYCVRELKGW